MTLFALCPKNMVVKILMMVSTQLSQNILPTLMSVSKAEHMAYLIIIDETISKFSEHEI